MTRTFYWSFDSLSLLLRFSKSSVFFVKILRGSSFRFEKSNGVGFAETIGRSAVTSTKSVFMPLRRSLVGDTTPFVTLYVS